MLVGVLHVFARRWGYYNPHPRVSHVNPKDRDMNPRSSTETYLSYPTLFHWKQIQSPCHRRFLACSFHSFFGDGKAYYVWQCRDSAERLASRWRARMSSLSTLYRLIYLPTLYRQGLVASCHSFIHYHRFPFIWPLLFAFSFSFQTLIFQTSK